jgi:hypothetical protein
MRRREFIAGLGGAAAWPFAARAQQQVMPAIGYLSGSSPQAEMAELGQFREGLSETGYVEGQNVAIEYRWARGRTDILASLTADLIRLRVSVLAGLASTAAVRAAATFIAPTRLEPDRRNRELTQALDNGDPTGGIIGHRPGLPLGQHRNVQTIFRHVDSAMREHLRIPSLLMRARAQATVRVWKMRPELHAHWRTTVQNGCGLPIATGRWS